MRILLSKTHGAQRMTNPDLERAARAIAVRLIPAYVNDAIWAEDLPMWRRRHERGGTSTDNPIGTARTALLAFLALDDSGVERLARAIYPELDPDDIDQYGWTMTEARAVISELRKMSGGEG
jgi:hypothetical protein